MTLDGRSPERVMGEILLFAGAAPMLYDPSRLDSEIAKAYATARAARSNRNQIVPRD
jgi:hypothetical protein